MDAKSVVEDRVLKAILAEAESLVYVCKTYYDGADTPCEKKGAVLGLAQSIAELGSKFEKAGK